MPCDPILGPTLIAGAIAMWAVDEGESEVPPEQIPDADYENTSKEELVQALHEVDPEELPDWLEFDGIDQGDKYSDPGLTPRGATSVDLDDLSFDDLDVSIDRQLMERRHCDSRSTGTSSTDSGGEKSFNEIYDEMTN